MNARIKTLLKSKTVWGAVFAAAGYLLKQPHVSTPEVAEALGGVLTAAGVRDSITQAVVLVGQIASKK